MDRKIHWIDDPPYHVLVSWIDNIEILCNYFDAAICNIVDS
jgi:hypothetical protein